MGLGAFARRMRLFPREVPFRRLMPRVLRSRQIDGRRGRSTPVLLTGLAVLLLLTAVGCSPATGGEPVIINGTAVAPVPTLDPAQVALGEQVYTQYCATCHGADLEGDPNWRQPFPDGSYPPPPQDSSGHSWHHPDDLLLEIIAGGGDPTMGGTMPGFGEALSREEMEAVLTFIKSRWGPEERAFQWWASASR